jgi:Icc protein
MQQGRREFLRWLTVAGAGLAFEPLARAAARLRPVRAFHPEIRLVQLTDLHWGFEKRSFPRPEATLDQALSRVHALKPDLVVFTGDFIQATRDPGQRAARLRRAWEALRTLHLPILAVPGEQDALLDQGRLFRQVIGPLYFHETVGGVHLLGLDNVSRGFFLGPAQVQWLSEEARKIPPQAPVLVLAHAPLARYFPPWNWYTFDGPEAARILSRFAHVLLLHGHVHQLMADAVGDLEGLGAWPLSFAYPPPAPPGLTPLEPVPPPPGQPEAGLGVRLVHVTDDFHIMDLPLASPTVYRL